MNSQPMFSFFRAPISNLVPEKTVTLKEVHDYITGPRAMGTTEEFRKLESQPQRRAFKAASFDYITPSGIFSRRGRSNLLQHSGLICIDFDHIGDVEALFGRLLEDEYFETELLFRSPSGHGLKWIIPIDLERASHEEWFASIAVYCRLTYGIAPDRQCRDISRACFLPCDPGAYLNPQRL